MPILRLTLKFTSTVEGELGVTSFLVNFFLAGSISRHLWLCSIPLYKEDYSPSHLSKKLYLIMEFFSKETHFASLRHIGWNSSANQTYRKKIEEAFATFQEKELVSAGNQFLIIWQNVQNLQQDLFSKPIIMQEHGSLYSDTADISYKLKDLEKLGLSLLHDAAIAFFLIDEPYKYNKDMRKYTDWPKLGSTLNCDSQDFKEGTAIASILDDIKHPLDVLLENSTTTRQLAEMLSHYYLVRSNAYDIKGEYSANIECIIGHSQKIPTEKQLKILNNALTLSGNELGRESKWIKACINSHRASTQQQGS